MKIAVLSWGSLYWDKRDLAISSEWNNDGVILPIEFARISQDGRLTLVITEAYGSEIKTYWAYSNFDNLEEAIKNLMRREGSTQNGIGYFDIINQKYNSDLSNIEIKKIEKWVRIKKIEAVIWTELKSNYEEKTGMQFTINDAINYLDNLESEIKIKAKEYIKKAPKQTMTALRIKLNE